MYISTFLLRVPLFKTIRIISVIVKATPPSAVVLGSIFLIPSRSHHSLFIRHFYYHGTCFQILCFAPTRRFLWFSGLLTFCIFKEFGEKSRYLRHTDRGTILAHHHRGTILAHHHLVSCATVGSSALPWRVGRGLNPGDS